MTRPAARGPAPSPAGELLSRSSLFAGLGPDALAGVADAAHTRRVEAGEVLFAQGDVGDTLYLVRTGRVEVLVDGAVVRSHGRGEVFGELALLLDGRRSATVVARRDTELLALDRDALDRLLAHAPGAVALLRRLAGHLRAPTAPAGAPGTVLALVGAEPGAPAAVAPALARRLVAHLGGPGRVARLDDAGTPDRPAEQWAAALERAEATHAHVLLVARGADTGWGRFCLRQADRPLLLVDPARGLPRDLRAPGRAQLVVLGAPGRARLDGERPVHHLDPGLPDDDVARLARRASGRALGLVLSGGGARGLAHIGLLEVLDRDGIPVDRLGGTSMGAVVAGLAALGASPEEMVATARRELVRARPFGDPTWPRHSLVRGRRLDRSLARTFGTARVEDQRRSLFTVSADLVAGRPVVHRRGPLAEAVALSVRLPGLTPPRRIGRRLHVDGGVLDNLPIGTMADDGEGPVVACDVALPFDAPAIGRPGTARGLPHIVDTIGRSMTLASWHRGQADRHRAHAVVVPELGALGMFDFARVEELVDAGRRAAQEALPAVRAAVASCVP